MRKLIYILILSSASLVQAQENFNIAQLDSIPTFNLESALENPNEVKKITLKGKKTDVSKVNFSQFKNLQVLIIKRNNLETIPENITKCKTIKYLEISNNNIKNIPEKITDLENLMVLRLGQNKIDTIPEFIVKLKNLEILDLWGNEMTTIPPELNEMIKLKLLDLRMIEFSQDKQNHIKDMLPWVQIKFSYSCNCGD